jgi:hypothetical protein
MVVLGAIVLVAAQLIDRHTAHVNAQVFLSSTPVPLSFPTNAPMMTPLQLGATEFPTFTPTAERGPYLQLREGSGEVNVRQDADPSAEILGVIGPGEQYEITGQYFLWYQISYENSRNGRGFVFGELFDVVGDASAIPDLTQNTPTPTLNPELFGPTLTYEAILNSPGGEQTLAASQREIAAPGEADAAGNLPSEIDPQAAARPILPTFTYPPEIVAQAPSPAPPGVLQERDNAPATPSDDIAPIVPIAVLIGLGVIAFLLSLLQR